ncbi:MAG: STAS domain-containing protein [Planctomycetota bacterium]
MDDRSNEPEFALQGNRLAVRGEMDPNQEARYSHELFRLLESASPKLELDLTEMHRMSSSYIGATCLFLLVARKEGLLVSVRANAGVAKALRVSGVDGMANVTVTVDAAT